MKFYHFGLAFAIIAAGFFVMAQTRWITTLQREELQRNEYDCLVAAVNGAVEAVFTGTENTVTKDDLKRASEVFFQTLSVLHGGMPNEAEYTAWRDCVPLLAVFEERGYYCYCFVEGVGYEWSELIPYEGEGISDQFFAETEELLVRYHALHYTAKKTYRMVAAEEGVWERSLSRASVFAVYAPPLTEQWEEGQDTFLYAAAKRTKEAYLVTEDNYCHVPSCAEVKKKKTVARYTTQKESAYDGAMPCEQCLK